MTDKNLLAAISGDRALGSSLLFAHRHPDESPQMHVEILDLWGCADEFVLIEAFREGGKSTLAEEFLLLEGAFGNFRYCVMFGETYAKACQRLEAIAFEATRNIKLKALFGKVLARKPIENKLWFASGAFMEAVGWEQEVTGFKYLDARPDRAHFDDVENLERVRDSAAVDVSMKKLYREVIPAMDKRKRRLRFTQTPRAADCMVTRLRANPDWLCRSFPICTGEVDDPKAVPAWPARYPMQWVRAERDRFQRAGMLKEFNQEYLLRVDAASERPFDESMIRSVDVAPAAWLPRYAIYDPSRTSNATTSARTGRVVVSRLGSRIIVHESSGHYWKPDEIREDIFRTHERHHCAEVGVEKDSLDEFLMQPLRFEMLRRGRTLPLKALNAPKDRGKEEFILGLQPFFKASDVWFVGGRGNHPQLVAEMLNFPSGTLDVINALAYSLRMFAGDPVYEDFGEDNVAPAHEPARGETVYACWNATENEVVCALLLRHGRHLSAAADWSAHGAIADSVKTIAAELRAAAPRARIESWVPQQLFDESRRVALTPALRAEHLNPYRGEHGAVARGALAERIRTKVRDRRLFTADRRATLTLAALAGGYKYPISGGNAKSREPEPGLSRLVAEAIETLVVQLDRGVRDDAMEGVGAATNPQGARYHSALPGGRR